MILKLKDGDVKIELFEDVAPNHVKRIKELANSGKYDNVVFHRVIDGFMAQTGDVKFGNSESKNFDLRKAGMGGSIGDIGSHAFNLADFITGAKLEELCADISSFVEGRKNDDNAHVLLRYENGAKGMLWSSQVAPGNENALKIRIYGDKGGLEWEQENPNYLRVDIFGKAKKIIRRDL